MEACSSATNLRSGVCKLLEHVAMTTHVDIVKGQEIIFATSALIGVAPQVTGVGIQRIIAPVAARHAQLVHLPLPLHMHLCQSATPTQICVSILVNTQMMVNVMRLLTTVTAVQIARTVMIAQLTVDKSVSYRQVTD